MWKISIIAFFVIVGLLFVPKFLAMRSLEPGQNDLFLKGIVEKVIPVKIPGAPSAFNPALIPYQGHYLMAFRFDDPRGLSLKKIWKKRSPYLGIVELDNNFKPIAPFQLLNTRPGRPEVPMQAEDPRLIAMEGKIYLFFNDIKEGTTYGNRWMYMSELKKDEEKFTLGTIHRLNPPHRPGQVEKNWMPFAYQNELYAVYRPYPHEVLKINTENGSMEKLFITKPNFEWKLGVLSGGTQAIEFENRFLAFTHSSVWTKKTPWRQNPIRHYFMAAYTFENEPPFKVTSCTPGPLHHPEFYLARNKKRIIFPSGLTQDDTRIYVAYGENDCYINIAVIDKEKLKAAFNFPPDS